MNLMNIKKIMCLIILYCPETPQEVKDHEPQPVHLQLLLQMHVWVCSALVPQVCHSKGPQVLVLHLFGIFVFLVCICVDFVVSLIFFFPLSFVFL